MSGYTSDQLVAHSTTDGQLVPTTQRARITGIQAEGAASSSVVTLKAVELVELLIATFKFGTEGINYYVPGSGILFEEGVYLDLTATPGVTITFT